MVINGFLCYLPEKERKEIVEETKEIEGQGRNKYVSEETEKTRQSAQWGMYTPTSVTASFYRAQSM